MSTVGVGQAARAIDREGSRARSRSAARVEARRERTQAGTRDGVATALSACAACGASEAIGDLYGSEAGPVCAVCFQGGDGAVVAAEPELGLRALARPLMYSPFLTLLALGVLGADFSAPPYWLDVVTLVWVAMTGIGFFVGPVLLLSLVERARQDWRRPGLEPGQAGWLVAAHAWHALGFVAFEGLAVLTPWLLKSLAG